MNDSYTPISDAQLDALLKVIPVRRASVNRVTLGSDGESDKKPKQVWQLSDVSNSEDKLHDTVWAAKPKIPPSVFYTHKMDLEKNYPEHQLVFGEPVNILGIDLIITKSIVSPEEYVLLIPCLGFSIGRPMYSIKGAMTVSENRLESEVEANKLLLESVPKDKVVKELVRLAIDKNLKAGYALAPQYKHILEESIIEDNPWAGLFS